MNNIQITKGKLGSLTSLPKNGLEIKPLTVFIGKQGTGKSLISQFVYFFTNLPYLATYQLTTERKPTSNQNLVRIILDNLRSDRRAIGVFADPRTTLKWNDYSITLDQRNRKIEPNKALLKYIDQIINGEIKFKQAGKALFVPAERVIFPHARPSVWKLLSWPSTLILYGDALQNSNEIFSQWDDNQPNSAAGRKIQELSYKALNGKVVKYGKEWRWQIDHRTTIDLDMASSGQKANWSWLLLAETLLDEKEQGLLDEPFRIHIEEPEIHLHPAAQKEMIRVLAFLANQGIEVLLTTHSLTMLYELNNLMTASSLLPVDFKDDSVPEPDFRILASKVAAYLFKEDGHVVSLIEDLNISITEDETKFVPWINEDLLREVDEELGQELSKIRSYNFQMDK